MCAKGLSGHRETRVGRTQNTPAALKTPDQRWGLKKPETREQSRLWLPHWARGPDAEACLVGREYSGVYQPVVRSGVNILSPYCLLLTRPSSPSTRTRSADHQEPSQGCTCGG